MQRTFSHTLLITWILLLISCKSQFVQTSYQTHNISVSQDSFNENKAITELITPYKSALDKDMNKVISFSEVELIKDKPESLLTNLMADLILEKGKQIGNNLSPAINPDISYINYGGIRAPLPKGNITVGNIFELMPFENELVFLLLSGKQVKTFLNVVAQKGGDSVGGVRLTIRNEMADEILIDGRKIQDQEKYWLATNDYVANGGDDFHVFTENENYISTGEKIRDLIISFLEEKHHKNEKLEIKLDGRISHG